MATDKHRGRGYSSSEMPTALWAILPAPPLCSHTLGCARRNTCFQVGGGAGGGAPSAQAPALLHGETPPQGGVVPGGCVFGISRSEGGCFSPPHPQISGSEGIDLRYAPRGHRPCCQGHLRGSSEPASPQVQRIQSKPGGCGFPPEIGAAGDPVKSIHMSFENTA